MADDIASIKRLAKWTFGILCMIVGSGGVYQLWQIIVWAIKRFALIMFAISVTSCFRATEKSATVETTHRIGVESGKPVDVLETRKTETTSERESSVDIGPVVAAAVRAATGDLAGAVSSLAGKTQAFMESTPKPKSPVTGSDLLDMIIAAMGGYAAIKGTVAAGRKITSARKA